MSHDYTLSAASTAWRPTVALLDRLFPPPRAFAVRLWDGTTLPASTDPAFTIVLNHPGALRRMFTPPVELSLGEAFIYGDFDVDGDLFATFALLDDLAMRAFSPGEIAALAQAFLALPKSGATRLAGRGAARLRGAPHSRGRDRAAIQYHYDVGNDFYALWLDSRMQYSCGYFPTDTEDLETAQEHKLDYICRKLRLRRGERLLDIGCGWGGLVMYAAEHYGIHVLGVTLSEQQAYYANTQIAPAGLGARASVKLCDYRDLGADSFDKIVSVGMFEHVGRRRLPDYFAAAYRLLKPGGLFLNHGITQRASVMHTGATRTPACCAPSELRASHPGSDSSGGGSSARDRLRSAMSFRTASWCRSAPPTSSPNTRALKCGMLRTCASITPAPCASGSIDWSRARLKRSTWPTR
jgi:cyclopropane-fatty-acyl-phospholipid synthase